MSGSTEASGGFEVPTPILNSPLKPPAEYWDLREGEPPQRLQGRRPAGYYYRDPRAGVQGAGGSRGVWREMPLVNTIRGRLDEWRAAPASPPSFSPGGTAKDAEHPGDQR